MCNNICNYKIDKVYEITPEVIELIGKYYFSEGSTFKPEEIINFLKRNNLKFNTDSIFNVIELRPQSAIPALAGLKNILTIFKTFTNARIIRTSKMNVLCFDECTVNFEDDLLKSLQVKNKSFIDFCIKYEYEYDVLKYKNYKSSKCNKVILYHYMGCNEYREFHISTAAGLDYIRVVHKKNSKKVFSTIDSSFYDKNKSIYDENETLVKSNDYIFDITYNEHNQIIKIVHNNINHVNEVTKYKYDEIGNVILLTKNYGYGDNKELFVYEYQNGALKIIYKDVVPIFCLGD